jgi:hypothetical protein
VGFVVDKVAMEQVFLRVLQFYPVKLISPVLRYKKKRKKLIIYLHHMVAQKASRLR